MRVFAQDAVGKKDTVYIGDDPNAQNGNGPAPFNDTQFGEIWTVPQNPNQFNFATYYWISPSDSVLKVDIENYSTAGQLYYNLTLDSAVFPITLKFDLNNLRSDSLPYPNQGAGIPTGQLEIYYGGVITVPYPGSCGSAGGPLVVSDTIAPSCLCCSKDSVVLADIFNNPSPQTAAIAIYITPWTGMTPVGINEYKTDKIRLIPNPFSEYLNYSAKNYINLSDNLIMTLTDQLGHEVYRSSVHNKDQNIDTREIQPGFYFIKIVNSKGVLIGTEKLIKN